MKKVLIFALVLVLIVGVCVFALVSKNHAARLTADERQTLEEINPALTTMPAVLELKKQGRLGELTEAIEEEYASRYASELENFTAYIESWGLRLDMTVGELTNAAQNRLDEKYNGIQIESAEFQNLVKEMLQGDAYPLMRMAEEDPDFGALYLYMCIYYDENISEETGNFTNSPEQPLQSAIMEKTLEEMFKADFDRNFRETATIEVVQRVSKPQGIFRQYGNHCGVVGNYFRADGGCCFYGEELW